MPVRFTRQAELDLEEIGDTIAADCKHACAINPWPAP